MPYLVKHQVLIRWSVLFRCAVEDWPGESGFGNCFGSVLAVVQAVVGGMGWQLGLVFRVAWLRSVRVIRSGLPTPVCASWACSVGRGWPR